MNRLVFILVLGALLTGCYTPEKFFNNKYMIYTSPTKTNEQFFSNFYYARVADTFFAVNSVFGNFYEPITVHTHTAYSTVDSVHLYKVMTSMPQLAFKYFVEKKRDGIYYHFLTQHKNDTTQAMTRVYPLNYGDTCFFDYTQLGYSVFLKDTTIKFEGRRFRCRKFLIDATTTGMRDELYYEKNTFTLLLRRHLGAIENEIYYSPIPPYHYCLDNLLRTRNEYSVLRYVLDTSEILYPQWHEGD